MNISNKIHDEKQNIFVVPTEFKIEEINPYTNKKYDSNWIYAEITDARECKMKKYVGLNIAAFIF